MFSEWIKDHPVLPLLQSDYHPYPRWVDRAAWENLSPEKKAAITATGDEAISEGYPMCTATQFMAFVRTGDREIMQRPYFARRQRLVGAAMAECLHDNSRYLDAVIDGLWCVCEETSWVLSAHNDSALPKRPLPDVTEPYIDLYAAQTAATLAIIIDMLGDKLDAVTPLITRRVRLEMERRVFTPYLTHNDFGWMGMDGHKLNNWTPWIVSNVLEAFLLTERDRFRLADTVERSLLFLDRYLLSMTPDGGCDEGAGYFEVAGLSLLDALESVYLATGGKISFYHEELIQNIGRYPLHAYIGGNAFLNFADCDALPDVSPERIYRYGLRIGDADLMNLGAHLNRQYGCEKKVQSTQIARTLNRFFADFPEVRPLSRPAFMNLPDLQVFTWCKERMFFAAKGGDNAENHNHNDVGSFVLYVDGQPQVVDVGNMTYTAKTFGPDRYTLFNTRAENHNIPLIGGVEQQPGHQYRASDAQGNENGLTMQLRDAYPAEACVQSFTRAFDVGDQITLRDTITLTESKPITWVFMLRTAPTLSDGCADCGAVRLAFDPSLVVECAEIPVTDPRMAQNFPGSFHRLTLTAPAAAAHDQSFTLTIQ